MNRGETVLRLDDVARRYGDLVVVEHIDFTLAAGETAALLGPSGSGKSSLLHIAGLLEQSSAGEVEILGRATSGLNDAERTRIRRDTLGFVYQFHHLLPEFTALGNVALPQLISGINKAKAEKEAKRLLTAMGLGERLNHQPGQLSGGEQQRTAIARALANRPKILLADEPTGNLDPKTSDVVFDALLKLVREEGLSALIATHDQRLAKRMDRVFVIKDQRLVEVKRQDA
ncbi:ABC transporter ATP-binding protein [Hyphococcus flavus]|uniref:ABC transporter ATP-binding protein n=1 Tax=Hyphococcus flavus TaxID=1866326 RepID=A0AAE9ZHN3_9PROT|nr:ABC transporter ATP-binding protein [Hyphococcus flavus]WDI31026.1 ABC transporter ATP-binding protein [Hyphococcus flavus]